MALSNSQYDEIFRTYDERQLHNQHVIERRTKEAYAQIPGLKEIDDAIASCSVAQARKLLDGDSDALEELKQQLDAYRSKKAALLKEHGLSSDYFKPSYTCPDCKDTGYINGERCHCFKQAAIRMIYTQSNLKEVLEKENFNTFSYDYYSSEDINPATGRSSLDTIKDAVAKCHYFIDHFDDEFNNLYFYGDTGIGKTFLSNCIAKELLDRGYSVIYFTAFQLFDILGKDKFGRNENASDAHQNIFDCDLLIIDDLGTELSNSFTSSQLFLCLNERILRRKSTIISTNLRMNQLADIYSERVLSRISSSYTVMNLFGADIRILKRYR
ncbi:MAG: ATP-binding protein [Roseburia sp.]|nr:ATP-binding protein [Roseburia sp.]